MPTTVSSTSTVSVMSSRRPTLTPTASDTGEGSSAIEVHRCVCVRVRSRSIHVHYYITAGICTFTGCGGGCSSRDSTTVV